MPRRRERAIAVGGVLAVVAIAAIVVALLVDARDSGRNALHEARVAQVRAVAQSLDVRIGGALSATSGLAVNDWELTLGSEADLDLLTTFLGPEARTGFFLIDVRDRITQGVLLPDTTLGSTFDRRGWADTRTSPDFERGVGAVLPVDAGLTTASPTYALALPIIDFSTGAYRGAFVFEADVSAESDFNSEIAQLRRAGTETEDWFLLDDVGVVVASTDASTLAEPIEDERYIELTAGRHSVGGRVVVVEDIPSAEWRLVNHQDRDEFEEGLVGPLQTAGVVVVVLSAAAAAIVVSLMLRRLRQARAEAQRLAELARQQEEFVSIVSHELRTPVSGILGFLQTTVDHWPQMTDEARHSAVTRAARNARRLQAMARDVLDTEAIESGGLAFVFERADLRDEADTAVVAARDLHPDRDILLDTPAVPVPVDVDPDRLQQVFSNLLDNALKNSPAGEAVTVAVRSDSDAAIVEVDDRGTGIDESTAELLFERFVRGRERGVTGTGLGLYITRRLVEAHGGTVDAAPGADVGTRFTVRLPLADEKEPR